MSSGSFRIPMKAEGRARLDRVGDTDGYCKVDDIVARFIAGRES